MAANDDTSTSNNTKENIITSQSPRLVLLDASGLLYCKIKSGQNIPQGADKTVYRTMKLRSYYSVARPEAIEFIEQLTDRYTVAIFSSTTGYNLKQMLPWVLGKDLYNKLAFTAERHSVKFDPDYGLDPEVTEFNTVKRLTDIWESPCFNSKRQWNEHNTILIEHELSKVRFNDEKNYILVDEWDISSNINVDSSPDSDLDSGLNSEEADVTIEDVNNDLINLIDRIDNRFNELQVSELSTGIEKL